MGELQVKETFFCDFCGGKLIPFSFEGGDYCYCPHGGGGAGHRKYYRVDDAPTIIDPSKIIGNESFKDACEWALARTNSPQRKKVIQEKLKIAESQEARV